MSEVKQIWIVRRFGRNKELTGPWSVIKRTPKGWRYHNGYRKTIISEEGSSWEQPFLCEEIALAHIAEHNAKLAAEHNLRNVERTGPALLEALEGLVTELARQFPASALDNCPATRKARAAITRAKGGE